MLSGIRQYVYDNESFLLVEEAGISLETEKKTTFMTHRKTRITPQTERPKTSFSTCILVTKDWESLPRHGSLLIQSTVSVSVSVSAQDLGKAHTRSAPSLSSLPKVALEAVPIFAWLNTDRSRPWRVECRPLPFSTPLSFRQSMLWCSGLSVLRKFLKPRSTSALPSCRPDVISAVLASLSACSFPLTLACPGQ